MPRRWGFERAHEISLLPHYRIARASDSRRPRQGGGNELDRRLQGPGTDSGVCRHGINAREMALLVKAGMSPIDALKSATSVNAELLGLASKIGSLGVGKQADVIAVPGDPSEDIRVTERVLFVMKDGKVVRKLDKEP
jgi:hypothetical protein